MHHLLTEILVFLAAAIIAVPLFRYFKQGAILAYLFAGIIIGPSALKLIQDHERVLQFSELGVVFLLFIIGLELQPERIWRMRNQIFGLGLAQMGLTGLVFTVLGYFIDLPLPAAVIAGFGLALSSTAFALQMLTEKRQLKTLHGQNSFSILLFQDLAVVPLIAIVPILAGAQSEPVSWLAITRMIAVVVVFILAGLYLVRYALRMIADTGAQEVFTASALLVVIGSAILMEYAGLSMGTGAFLAGVLLANSEYRHELETDLAPFKGLLLGLFFIAVGMSLDLGVIAAKPHYVLGIVVVFMTIKGGIIYLLGRVLKLPGETARNMAFALPQGGEFAFVLFAAAVGANLFDKELSSILAASVTISMALTPLLFTMNQKYLRTFSDLSERPYDAITTKETEVIIAGYGRFGQIVARFLNTQGIRYTILEHSASQIEVARRFGSKVFYGDASRRDIVEAAGAKEAKIFVLAIDDVEGSVKTAAMVRKHFPDLPIIARVRNRQHALELIEMGIQNVHRETYLTSLEVAREVAIQLGGSRDHIDKKIALFRTHDEKLLQEQLTIRHDENKMISQTTQAIAELEKILASDGVPQLGIENTR